MKFILTHLRKPYKDLDNIYGSRKIIILKKLFKVNLKIPLHPNYKKLLIWNYKQKFYFLSKISNYYYPYSFVKIHLDRIPKSEIANSLKFYFQF